MKEESDSNKMKDFEIFLENFLINISSKYEIEFKYFRPKCCAYKKNKFWILGVQVYYFDCYKLLEIDPIELQEMIKMKGKIKKLQTIFTELNLEKYCSSTPKFYSNGDDYPLCT